MGEEFLRLENWPVALNYFEQAIKEDPGSARAWYGKGISYCQMEKYDDGLAALAHALQLDPKNVNYIFGTGVCYEMKGKDGLKAAELYYKKVMELAPTQSEIHLRLANVYSKEGRCQDAIPEFRKAIDLNPNQFPAYNNLANCYLQLKQPDQAVTLFQQAIARTEYPGQFHFYHHLGIALLAANRMDEAKAAFLVETALNPDFLEAHLNLGNIYFLNRSYERAIEEYSDVLSIDPKSEEGHFSLGQLYLLINQPELAKQHFEQLVQLKPEDGKGYWYLSLCYSKLGDERKAGEMYNKSLTLGYHPESVKEQIRRGQNESQ